MLSNVLFYAATAVYLWFDWKILRWRLPVMLESERIWRESFRKKESLKELFGSIGAQLLANLISLALVVGLFAALIGLVVVIRYFEPEFRPPDLPMLVAVLAALLSWFLCALSHFSLRAASWINARFFIQA